MSTQQQNRCCSVCTVQKAFNVEWKTLLKCSDDSFQAITDSVFSNIQNHYFLYSSTIPMSLLTINIYLLKLFYVKFHWVYFLQSKHPVTRETSVERNANYELCLWRYKTKSVRICLCFSKTLQLELVFRTTLKFSFETILKFWDFFLHLLFQKTLHNIIL